MVKKNSKRRISSENEVPVARKATLYKMLDDKNQLNGLVYLINQKPIACHYINEKGFGIIQTTPNKVDSSKVPSKTLTRMVRQANNILNRPKQKNTIEEHKANLQAQWFSPLSKAAYCAEIG